MITLATTLGELSLVLNSVRDGGDRETAGPTAARSHTIAAVRRALERASSCGARPAADDPRFGRDLAAAAPAAQAGGRRGAGRAGGSAVPLAGQDQRVQVVRGSHGRRRQLGARPIRRSGRSATGSRGTGSRRAGRRSTSTTQNGRAVQCSDIAGRFAAALAAALLAQPAPLAGRPRPSSWSRPATERTVSLVVGTGQLIRVDREFSSLFVANPEVADIEVKSPRLLYLTGVGVGRDHALRGRRERQRADVGADQGHAQHRRAAGRHLAGRARAVGEGHDGRPVAGADRHRRRRRAGGQRDAGGDASSSTTRRGWSTA